MRRHLSGYADGVTVVIPTIPPRMGPGGLFERALRSVQAQTRQANAVSISIDHHHTGSAETRNRALKGVSTRWTAFLDDDDTMYPGHLERLLMAAESSTSDVFYPWFDVPFGFDPWPDREGQPFDRELLRTQNYIPITVLARTELLHDVDGFRPKDPTNRESLCDDWGTWEALLDAGAVFEHVPSRTWAWHWHPGNTSGRPDRWA